MNSQYITGFLAGVILAFSFILYAKGLEYYGMWGTMIGIILVAWAYFKIKWEKKE